MNRLLLTLALFGAVSAPLAVAQELPGGPPQPELTVPEPGSAALALLALGAGVVQRVRAARRRRDDSTPRD